VQGLVSDARAQRDDVEGAHLLGPAQEGSVAVALWRAARNAVTERRFADGCGGPSLARQLRRLPLGNQGGDVAI